MGRWSRVAGNGQEAFRWKQATGMIGLGVLPGGAVSVANAVNADGSVVVGDGDSANGSGHFVERRPPACRPFKTF